MQKLITTTNLGTAIKRWHKCLSLSLWLSTACLYAAEVPGLYDAAVAINSRDNERERQQGFTAAMKQTLVKLTGRQDTLQNLLVSRAVSNAQSYVESWAYRSAVLPNVDAAGEQLLLQVSFFPSEIQNLLTTANIPVWPQNRPETLLWVVIEDELGERIIAGSENGAAVDNSAEIHQELLANAAVYGMPLLLPLLDFADQRSLQPDQLWNFDLEAIRLASLRYGEESILVLRIYRSLSGEIISKCVYLFRDQELQQESIENSLQLVLATTIKFAAEELAGYYAVSLSATDNNTLIKLTVDGIQGINDYAGLLNYAGTLATVKSVELASVQHGTVNLSLHTSGQLRQLIENIALDKRMTPAADVTRAGELVNMHYVWQPQ